MAQTLESDSRPHLEQTAPIPAVKESGTPSSMTLRWITSVEDLESIEPQWHQLADNAVWRNSLFEPNALIPAFRYLSNGNVRVLIVEDSGASRSTGEKQLLGLVPVVRKKFYHLPISCFEIWKHDQSFDATPLINKTNTLQILKSIFEFLSTQKTALLSLDTISAEPEFQNILQDAIQSSGHSLFKRATFARPALRPAGSSDEYLQEFVSKNLRKKARRLARRLEEQGEVTFESSDDFSDYNQLTQQFLEIESSGWKFKSKTALACNSNTKRFYQELIFRSAQRGKARFLSLKLDGKPIIMLSDIQSGGRVSSFKTGYDERFAAYSPGLQLEMKNIQCLHQAGIDVADSCIQPENKTLSRIWGQHLQFQHLVIGLRPILGRCATGLMPWIQSAAQSLKRVRR